MEYGLIGNPLGHSYSKQIHEGFNDYKYEIHPLEENELDDFFREKNFKAINVTIPYKEKVIKYCTDISDLAKEIGSINTIVKDKNNNLHGYNTDYYGFLYCCNSADIHFDNKKVVILGTGGTSKTAQVAVKHNNCKSLTVVSRTGEINYDNIYEKCKNAEIIINTTPVGMYPHTNEQAVDLSIFPDLTGVVDVIYNPLNTYLIQQAQELNLKCTNGLSMLIAQGIYASDIFQSRKTDKNLIPPYVNKIKKLFAPIALIGMPGSGKTTTGKLLSKKLNLKFIDTDKEIENRENMSISKIFELKGEEYFRNSETEIISDVTSKPGYVISLGGGAVLSEENRKLIKRNCIIIQIKRDIEKLDIKGRPLSENYNNLIKMEKQRMPIYDGFCDFSVYNNSDLTDTIKQIKNFLGE